MSDYSPGVAVVIYPGRWHIFGRFSPFWWCVSAASSCPLSPPLCSDVCPPLRLCLIFFSGSAHFALNIYPGMCGRDPGGGCPWKCVFSKAH
ncbi:hypothetical protein F7725_022839, partial [Dissostichus mawsoni]